jgi:hypothetical protein
VPNESVPPHVVTLVFESHLPVSARALYDWHAEPGAFERLAPPGGRVKVLERKGTIRDGDRLVMRIRVAPFLWRTWEAVHRDHVEGRGFTDVQVRGPFPFYEHRHRFEPLADGTSKLVDEVRYRVPFGPLGRLLLGAGIRRDMERLFARRHAVTREDLAARAAQRSTS